MDGVRVSAMVRVRVGVGLSREHLRSSKCFSSRKKKNLYPRRRNRGYRKIRGSLIPTVLDQ